MKKKNNWYNSFEQKFVKGLEVVHAKACGKAKGSIVFVHGVCHGAWCWENFLKYFSDAGYDCFALSLRGHGESKKKGRFKFRYKISDYVDDVKEVVAYCQGITQQKPFIIGHSMGGAIVQQYIDKYSGTVCGAVLFAPVTAEGMGCDIFSTSLSKSGLCTLPTVSFGRNTVKILKNSNFFVAKYGKKNIVPRILDMEKLTYYNEQLCSESIRAMWGLITYKLKNAINIPVFVIGSYADAYFPFESLEKTEKKYHTKHFAFPDLCHDMMLDEKGWEDSASAVLEFLTNPDKLQDNPESFVEYLKNKFA